MEFFVYVLLIFAAMKIYDAMQHQKKSGTQYRPSRRTNVDYGSFANSYEKVPLLTKREWNEYQILKEAAARRGLMICPKVRLLDLVEPKPNARNNKTLLNKVMSKHVDFVICNQDMEVICIIELDDTTHLRQDRMERDDFVDAVLRGAGYKIIHTWAMEPDILDFLDIHLSHSNQSYEAWKAQKMMEQRQ